MTAPSTDPLAGAVGYDMDTFAGDTRFDGAGRPLLVAGIGQYWARVGRALAATPGSILGYPTLGAGLDAAVEEALTPARVGALASDATATIEADPLTAAVPDVSVTPDATASGVVYVEASVVLMGLNAPIPLRWAFRASTTTG